MWLQFFVLLGLCTVTGVTNSVVHPCGTVDQGPYFTLSQTVRDILASCNLDLLQNAEFLAKLKFRSCSGSCLFSVSDLSRIDRRLNLIYGHSVLLYMPSEPVCTSVVPSQQDLGRPV